MTGLWKISHRWIILHGSNVILAFVALSPSLWICGIYDAKSVVFTKFQCRSSVLILLFFIFSAQRRRPIFWSFALRNNTITILATSSTWQNQNKQPWKLPKFIRKSRKIFPSGEAWSQVQISIPTTLNDWLRCELS